jgi:hypothetical protein
LEIPRRQFKGNRLLFHPKWIKHAFSEICLKLWYAAILFENQRRSRTLTLGFLVHLAHRLYTKD